MGDPTLRLRDFSTGETYLFETGSAFQDSIAVLMAAQPCRVLWADLPDGPTRTWPLTGQEFPMTGLTIGCNRWLHTSAVRYYEPGRVWFSFNEEPYHPEASLPLAIGVDSSGLFPWYSHLRFEPIPALIEEFTRSGGKRPGLIQWRSWSPSQGPIPMPRPADPTQISESSISFLNLVEATP